MTSQTPQKKRRLQLDRLPTATTLLAAKDAHYLGRVLRLKPGAQIEIFDGHGNDCLAEVVLDPTGHLAVTPLGPSLAQTQKAIVIEVACAIAKGRRADWLVEKLAELGADKLTWLQCERSVVKTSMQGEKAERWQRLASAAARQSDQSHTLHIAEPKSLQAFLAQNQDPHSLGFIAHPKGEPIASSALAIQAQLQAQLQTQAQPQAPISIRILIGPEGGFTANELGSAAAAGYTALSIATSILRVETAAVAACAILKALIPH